MHHPVARAVGCAQQCKCSGGNSSAGAAAQWRFSTAGGSVLGFGRAWLVRDRATIGMSLQGAKVAQNRTRKFGMGIAKFASGGKGFVSPLTAAATRTRSVFIWQRQREGERHSGAPMLRRYAMTSAWLLLMADRSAVSPLLQGR